MEKKSNAEQKPGGRGARNVRTILQHPQFPALLKEPDGIQDEQLKGLVQQWWDTARHESVAEDELRSAIAEMERTRDRHTRLLGGREVVEAMIIRRYQAISTPPVTESAPGGDGRHPGGGGKR